VEVYAAVFPTPIAPKMRLRCRLQSLYTMPAEGNRERILLGHKPFLNAIRKIDGLYTKVAQDQFLYSACSALLLRFVCCLASASGLLCDPLQQYLTSKRRMLAYKNSRVFVRLGGFTAVVCGV
jgi:hypothetical protein